MNMKVENGQVFTVVVIDTGAQIATIENFYSFERNVKLSSDKSSIASNGIEKAIITAKIFDYLGVQDVTVTGAIEFELLGERQSVDLINGICSIELTSAEVGVYDVLGRYPNFGEGVVTIESK